MNTHPWQETARREFLEMPTRIDGTYSRSAIKCVETNRDLAAENLFSIEHMNGNHTVWTLRVGNDVVRITTSMCEEFPVHVSTYRDER